MSLCRLSTLMSDVRPSAAPVARRKGQVITYGQFQADVRAVAAAFSTRRVVGLLCQDSYLFVVGLYGLFHAGAEIVLPPGNQPSVLDSLRGAFEILIDDAAIEAAIETTRQPSYPAAHLKPFDGERPLIDFCTSGTTGLPKRVRKSLAMFDRELAVLAPLLLAQAGDKKVLATVAHQHVYGFTFKIAWALAAGYALDCETHALWESLVPEITADTILVSSPAHLSRMDGLAPLPPSACPALVLSAGAPLSLAASRAAHAVLGTQPIEIFGSTETGGLAMRAQQSEDDPWRLLPSLSVRCDKEGRMALLSPFIGGGWIEMADVIVPVDGGFYHKGRADRIVKIEGKRINLINVEEALQALGGIEKAAAVMVHDPAQLAAVVELTAQGKAALAQEGAFRFGRRLRKELTDALDPAGVPRLWRFVEAWPSGAMGKRRDSDLIALFGEGP